MKKNDFATDLSPLNAAIMTVLFDELRKSGGRLLLSLENRTRLGRLGIMASNLRFAGGYFEEKGIARILPTAEGVALVKLDGVDLDKFAPPDL